MAWSDTAITPRPKHDVCATVTLPSYILVHINVNSALLLNVICTSVSSKWRPSLGVRRRGASVLL
jgi:hypothetical protein